MTTSNNPLGLFISAFEKNLNEKALREKNELLQLVIDNIPQFIFWKDTNCVYLGCNKNFAQIAAGFTCVSDVIGKTDFELPWAEVEGERIRQSDLHVLETGQPQTHIIQPRSKHTGEFFLVDTNKFPLHDPKGRVIGILGVYQDLTELIKTEQTLLESEERFRAVFENAPLGIGLADLNGYMIASNPALQQMLGYTSDELKGLYFNQFTHSEDLDADVEYADKVKSGNCDHYQIEKRYIRKDGSIFWANLKLSLVKDQRGEPKYVIGMVEDISETKRAEADLYLQSSAINAASDMIVISDTYGNIEFVNPAFVRDVGYQLEDIVGTNAVLLISEEHDQQFLQEIWITVLSRGTWHGEIICKRKDSSLFTADVTITPVRSAAGSNEHIIAILRDITEKKIYEEHISQSNKMETVGRLAAGIAHDFNNLLQGILGYTRMLMQDGALDTSVLRDLEAIHRSALRGGDLVRQILAFSRQMPGRTDLVDVSALVQETVWLLSSTLPRSIIVSCRGEQSVPKVLADPSQIQQVLMNLCINSRDAMPGGGRLTLAVDHVRLDEPFAKNNPWARTGSFVRCVVSDTGCGMDDETRKRVFEPFFSTKSNHEGTGLGLSSSYGILHSFGGMINIESTPGKGASVSVYLPAIEAAERQEEESGDHAELHGRGETVLVVEDEESIRKLTKRMLEYAGYSVFVAANGREAVDFLQANPADLVLLDLNMPEMNGIQALSVIRKLSPEVKILITTGYDSGIDDIPLSEYPDGVLRKPCEPETMLATIARILNEQASSND